MAKKKPFFLEFDAAMLKAACLMWCRFPKQMSYVATEAGAFNSDVLAATEKEMIEIETKISIYDLKEDFKKNKHHFYHRASEGHAEKYIPNKFYFAVPARLADEALKMINSEKFNRWMGTEGKKSYYGLLSFDMNAAGDWGDRVTVIQQAKTIHKEPPTPKALYIMLKRMSSELCTFHMKKFLDSSMFSMVVDTTKQLIQMPDFEYTEEDRKAMNPEPEHHECTTTFVYEPTGETHTHHHKWTETFEMPLPEKPTKQQEAIKAYLKEDPEGSPEDPTPQE